MTARSCQQNPLPESGRGFLFLFPLLAFAAPHRGTSRWLRVLVVYVLLRVGVPNLGGSLVCGSHRRSERRSVCGVEQPRNDAAGLFVSFVDTPVQSSCHSVVSCFVFPSNRGGDRPWVSLIVAPIILVSLVVCSCLPADLGRPQASALGSRP